MSNVLVVVDVQKGFINENTKHIVPKIAKLVENKFFDHVIFTKFVNVEGSPYKSIMNWHRFSYPPENEIVDELQTKNCKVFVKTGYTIFTPEVIDYFLIHNINEVYLVGIDTDSCVLKSAADSFERGYVTYVLADYCASHYGLEYHKAALMILKKFIGENRIVYGDFKETSFKT